MTRPLTILLQPTTLLICSLVLGCNEKPADAPSVNAAPTTAPQAAAPTPVPAKPQPAPQPAVPPPAAMNLTVDQLDTMFTGNASGPEDIKRAEAKYRGAEVTVRGTVYELSTEMNTITLKGKGTSYANCRFDGPLPAAMKKGKPATFNGVVAGFFLQVNVDHCSVVTASK